MADGKRPLLPLEVRGLVYRAGGRNLIDELDLSLGAGPLSVIMGPNGAGKSLLLRLLHGLLPPSCGEIRWHGETGQGEDVRRRQALVFQRPVLLRRSVRDNLDFALRVSGRRSAVRRDELLRHVGLAARARQPARLLSGGEQQRLALGRRCCFWTSRRQALIRQRPRRSRVWYVRPTRPAPRSCSSPTT